MRASWWFNKLLDQAYLHNVCRFEFCLAYTSASSWRSVFARRIFLLFRHDASRVFDRAEKATPASSMENFTCSRARRSALPHQMPCRANQVLVRRKLKELCLALTLEPRIPFANSRHLSIEDHFQLQGERTSLLRERGFGHAHRFL